MAIFNIGRDDGYWDHDVMSYTPHCYFGCNQYFVVDHYVDANGRLVHFCDGHRTGFPSVMQFNFDQPLTRITLDEVYVIHIMTE